MTIDFRRRLIVTLIVSSLPLSAWAQSPAGDDALRSEIEALKKGQADIRRELQEIKSLLVRGQQPAAAARAEAALPETVDINGDRIRGDRNAPIAIIEYSDYECPFCARYVSNTYPQIEKEYIQTGRVKYVFRDLPLAFHRSAFKAAEASHCAGEQGKFWEMHDRLFQNNKALSPADLAGHGDALGLDEAKFKQCLDSGQYADAIRQDVTQANGWGITGTPTFLIGVSDPDSSIVKVKAKVVGARPFADFKTALDSLVATPQ